MWLIMQSVPLCAGPGESHGAKCSCKTSCVLSKLKRSGWKPKRHASKPRRVEREREAVLQGLIEMAAKREMNESGWDDNGGEWAAAPESLRVNQ